MSKIRNGSMVTFTDAAGATHKGWVDELKCDIAWVVVDGSDGEPVQVNVADLREDFQAYR
jgi:hypothetical protein